MWGSTVDNRQALVFYSHPITVKGVFQARNSPKSTMTASWRNKISLAFPVLSHVRRTKAWENWSQANRQCQLNKDNAVLTQTGSIWQSHGDGRWPSGFTLLIRSSSQPPSCKHSQENGLMQNKKAVTKHLYTNTYKPNANVKIERLRLALIHTSHKVQRARERGKKNFWSYSHFCMAKCSGGNSFSTATWGNMTYPHF